MVQFSLNGQTVRSSAPNTTPLLNVLANDLQVNGTKFGCGKAQCNACLVMVVATPSSRVSRHSPPSLGERSPPWQA